MSPNLEKLEALRKKSNADNRAIWTRIKTEAPDVAAFLTEVNQAFGKPEAVKVVIGGDVVLDKGEMLPMRTHTSRRRR